MLPPVLLELSMVLMAALIALAFRPFAVLRAPALRVPWVAALGVLPLLWATPLALPGTASLQLSGACLLVLMFGWPLAIWTLMIVAAAVGVVGGSDAWPRIAAAALWQGVLPATFALAIGIAIRRWLPPHPFVYILGRAFIGSALAMMAAGGAATLVQPLPVGFESGALLTGHWLMAWGEAFLTGMLVAIFVAFKPAWLLTWSDQRYLPGPPPG